MQKIYKKFDKSKLSTLPRVQFDGKIVVINGDADAQKAVDYLMRQTRVGIDTETRPSFRKGEMHGVALLQVATYKECFLFRLNRIGVPDCVASLLESEDVCKVGLSLTDDFIMLRHRRKNLAPRNVVELQKLAPTVGIEDMSLQKLYANLLGGYISKRQQLTNWETDSLTQAQQLYASTDAWACLQLEDEIEKLKSTGDYELIEENDQHIS